MSRRRAMIDKGPARARGRSGASGAAFAARGVSALVWRRARVAAFILHTWPPSDRHSPAGDAGAITMHDDNDNPTVTMMTETTTLSYLIRYPRDRTDIVQSRYRATYLCTNGQNIYNSR